MLTLTGSQSQAKNITLDSKSTTSTQQAKVIATDTLNMMTPDLLNNTQGVLSASNISIHTEKLNNHQGSINQSSQDDFSLTLKNGLDNRQGSITTNAKNFNIHTGTLNNHQGHIKHTGAILGMTVADMNNTQGSILSTGDHTLNVKNVINNHQGVIQANTLTTTAKQLDNSDGKLLTSHHQSLTLTNDINNHQGLIQAGDFTITASQLNNHQGVLLATDDKSQNHITLTGELNNRVAQKAATIATAGNLAMTASKVQNTGNISSRTLDIQADKIHHAGNITSQTNVVMKGTLGIETTQTSLVFAGGDAKLSSQSGIAHHGQLTAVNHLSVDAAQLDLSGSTNQAVNISYASKADIMHQHATSGATNGIVINNTNGTLSNQQGSITAKTVNLDSKALQNGGSIYAKALTIRQIDDYTHTKQDKLIADNLNFNTQGSFTNQGELTANQTLNLTAKSITNDKDATINAANSTHLDSQSYLNNQGLINGNATYIKAKNTINNQAGGRIYGTHLAIAADTLNNTPAKIHDTDATHTAPVIAARQRLDIGVQYLNNHPNPDRHAKFNQDFLGQALITSLGSLHIGGSLNDNYHAIGKAQKVVNRGATIQSGGQMVIGSHSLLNTNADYQKQTIEVDKQEGLVFYRPQNTTEEHLQSDVDLRNTRKGLSDAVLYTKDSQGNFVNRGEDWDKITRTRIVSQDKTQHSDPARMVSGKNMVLDGMDLINDKSQMNAGNGYRVIAKHLNNNTDTALVGHTVEKFEGGFYQSHTVRWNRGKTKHRHSWGGRVYEPNTQKILETYELPILNANITTTPSKPTINQVALVDNDIDTALEALKSNQSALSSDAQKQLSALLAAKALGQTIDKALLAALINKLPQKIGGKTPTVVHTTPDGLTISNSALYTINANHPNLPIIQTDPAFTNHKNWLSSEYMLAKLDVDANHIHKRLGDGYYEQKQLQDQYQLLTGRHLLSDYQSQEQAFKTLMDQGITFAKQYQLSLGVALSAEQMANLTTDMVWLVKQPITYTKKDNEGNLITHTQEALVPKLYLRPANTATARLQPDGRYSSIGAKNINMHLTGNLDNGGNITATDALSIQANNAINKGNINAKFVAIDVNQDLINQHRIHADHAATLTAGHDIINQSQTSHQSQILGQSSASSTHIRQLAQISVGDGAKATDKDGKAPTTLSIKAGNYVIYTGANSQNQGGNTLISADKGIRLDAIKESSTINAIADDNNYFKHSQSKDIGSAVSGQGDVVLVTTGQDAAITGKAVNISSQAGKVLVSAMGDVHFSAGENKESIESTTTHKENKWYGKKDIKNTHESATNKAVLSHIASTAGVQMSSLAGDVSLLGSNIRTRGLASIHAKQGDVTLESVVDSVYQNATQTTQNFYKNTGSIDGSYQEMLNKTGISADGIDIQSKTTNLNAVDLKATNGAIIVGNAHLATDEDGKLKLDGNGKPIIVSGDMQNLSLGTVDLTNETWHEHSKSYRGFAKDLMKGAGVVAGALGIKDGITLAKSERHDAKTNTQAITKFDANHIQIGAQTVIATGTHFDAGTDGSVAILGDDILLTTAEHNQTSNQINTSQAITGESMKFGKDHLQLGAVVYADTKDMQTTQTTTHDGVIIRGSDVTILANMTNGNLTTYATNFDLGNNTGSLVIGAKNTLLDGVVNQSTNVQSSDINTTRIGASVHHVAVDTAVAAENLKEAIEAANQARKDLATAKDDIKAGRLQADAIKDYEANLAIATANIANAKIALGSTAASAAATAPTLGFSAKLGANHTQSQSQQTQANQDFVGTSIKAANVTFIGNDLTAKGLQGDISKLNVDHLNKFTLTHGTTTNTTKSQSNTNTLDASISTSGNMAAGMGRQQSHEGGTSTIAHDTKLNVGELNGYAKETTLHGATIVAQGGYYNTDTLNIHTSQNTQTHQSKHQGGNIGIGTNSLNLGYNQQNSQSDITTNNTPSGIIYITTDKAGDKHSLTAKHTSLTGGVIAAIHQDKDGNQTNDKLNFTTNTLTTQDLLATESTQSKGFGANLGLQSKEGSIKVSSIGLSANRNGSDKQTLALATIGQGATINHTITHNGQAQNATDLAQTAINTDATNTSKVIKDIKTGGLDINTTIDGRVFSKAGREEIKREQEGLSQNLKGVSKITAAAGVQSVASAGNLLTGNQTLAQVIQGAKAPAKMAKVIQDYPEIGAILDGYQKSEYHNLTLSQEALQALADATGVSTEVLLTSITAQQGIQGGTNKVLTVIDTHDKLKADSIQTLAHELDHVRGGKNETLADLAGLAAKLNTDAATLANQDKINPIKAQLGDGKDANTTALNQDLLERNDNAFFKDWVKNTERWQYIIQTTDGQQLARHKMFNGTQKLVYDYLQENYPDAFKANDEDFYRLVSQAMKEVGISDSIFIPFIGNEYYEDDVLMNKKESQSRTDKDDIAFYKKVFIKHMRETDGVWSDEEFKKFTESDVYYYEKIQNGIATQKVIQAGLEKGLPLAQAALGVGEVIGGTAALSTCPSVAGCVVAIAIITDGVDNVATAFVNYNEPIEEQIASLGLQNLGVDEQNANLIKLGTGLGTSVSAIVIARNADRLVDGGGILSKSDINIEDVDLKTNIHADLPKVLDGNPNVLTDSTVSKNHTDMSANLEAPNVDIGQNHGGVSLKEHIQANIADSQKARESSNFKSHANSENVHRIEHNAKLTTTTDGNLSVTHGLGYDAKKELDGIRAFLVENKKGENPFINNQGSHKGDPNKISIATATVTTKDGKTIHYLAVSGKSWSGHAPDKVTIHGKEYQVLRDEAYTGKVLSDGSKEKVLPDKDNLFIRGKLQKNGNHAEKKIMSHITQQNQNGANIDSIQLNIQNTSDEFKGACYGCGGQDGMGGTIEDFKNLNKDLKIHIEHGSTNTNP